MLIIAVSVAACHRSSDDVAAQSPDGGAADGAAPAICEVVAPRACPDPHPRFVDVVPILQRRCVPCHSGNLAGVWPLVTYGEVADWQDVIRDDLIKCTMPPPDAGVPMPVEETMVILDWLRCGLPD
jgi:hypothetical protein